MSETQSTTPAETKVLDLASALAEKVYQTESKATEGREMLLSEIRGLTTTVQARFDGIEREQADTRTWMGRLADAIDRQIQVTAKFSGFETKLAATDADIADLKLDAAVFREDLTAVKQDNLKHKIFRTIMITIVAACGGAVLTFIATKLATP